MSFFCYGSDVGNSSLAYPYGVNFASAGAGALLETHQGRSVIDVKSQIINFKNVIDEISEGETG
ncbi:unnamed protein product [Prunus armeniaca]|uniref:Uncharacterized protein n=1 Tax=Prunus armeniaca TaxID=36596 RepID=A0A6J5U7P4_PRUAR|nr:unnamed protein product [Prunus armeniaca]